MQLLNLLKGKKNWSGIADKMIWKMILQNIVWKWIEFYYMQISIPRRLEKPREQQRQKKIFRDSANVTEPDSLAMWYTSQKGRYHSEHIRYGEANRLPLYTWYGNHTQSLEIEGSLEGTSQYQLIEWLPDHWTPDAQRLEFETSLCTIVRSGLKQQQQKNDKSEEMNGHHRRTRCAGPTLDPWVLSTQNCLHLRSCLPEGGITEVLW